MLILKDPLGSQKDNIFGDCFIFYTILGSIKVISVKNVLAWHLIWYLI